MLEFYKVQTQIDRNMYIVNSCTCQQMYGRVTDEDETHQDGLSADHNEMKATATTQKKEEKKTDPHSP